MKELVKFNAESIKKVFCERLKELRADKQLSQKAIAEKLGCPVSTYANWEQGRRDPSIFDIYNIIKVLEIEANELFEINGL